MSTIEFSVLPLRAWWCSNGVVYTMVVACEVMHKQLATKGGLLPLVSCI